ncbi:MAG: glycosyltransferase [Limnothrix sp. RL_2_0]|nr:glycosyltransferase [Limnothrix sp. RL_2_0]
MPVLANLSWARLGKGVSSKVRYISLKISHILKFIQKNNLRCLLEYVVQRLALGSLNFLFANNLIDIYPDIPRARKRFHNIWLLKNHPRQTDLAILRKSHLMLKHQPLISIVVFSSGESIKSIHETIKSLSKQAYTLWEIIVFFNGLEKDIAEQNLEYQINKQSQSQIKVVSESSDELNSDSLNKALEISSGELITFLEAGGTLTPDALYKIAVQFSQHADTAFIYTDEDKNVQGTYLDHPLFKPDWCPDTFLSRFYIGYSCYYSKSAIAEINELTKNLQGVSALHDLALRLSELKRSVIHLSSILYHQPYAEDQFPPLPKGEVTMTEIERESSVRAIKAAIERRNEVGDVESSLSGIFSVRYKIRKYEKVTIIIPTKNLGKILNRCLGSIFEKTQYPSFEVIVVDNGSTELETRKVIDFWKENKSNHFSSIFLDVPFNFSFINNQAVSQTESQYLLFLNNDTEIITSGWLTAMVEQAQRNSIGAVGAMLLYPDSTIQHAGVLLGLGEVAGHCFQHYPANYIGCDGQAQAIGNYSAVTAACLMCRRKVFNEVGGFDEKLAVAYNDIDLCLKIIEAGYRNIYLPHVKLFHYESKSRGYDLSQKKLLSFSEEASYMKKRWQTYIDLDPCYNPNLPKRFSEHRKVYI